jgi:hypothetical protein
VNSADVLLGCSMLSNPGLTIDGESVRFPLRIAGTFGRRTRDLSLCATSWDRGWWLEGRTSQPWASVWIPMTPFLYRRAWQGVRRAPDALGLGLETRVHGASSGFASHHASIGPTGPTPTAKLAACAPERKTRRACIGRHTRGVSALSRGWGVRRGPDVREKLTLWHSYPKLDGAACRTAG